MKKLVLISTVLFFAYSQSFAQGDAYVGKGNPFGIVQDLQVQVFLNPGYERNNPNYKGSPYLNSDWIPGTLTFNSGGSIEGLQFKYDVYNKSMYFTNGKDTASIGNPGIVKEIKFANSTILYTSFLKGNEVDKDYFEILVAGEYRLLLYRSCKLLPAESVTQGYGQTEPARFITDKIYYVKKAEDPAIIVDKENNFLSILQAKTGSVSDFIKAGKLKLKKEEDLIKLVKFVNGEM